MDDELSRLISEALIPNVERLVRIWSASQIAIVFYHADPNIDARLLELLGGWDGREVQITKLTRQQRTRFVNAIDALSGNRAISRWLRPKDGQRLIAIVGNRLVYLNYDHELGFTVDPATFPAPTPE